MIDVSAIQHLEVSSNDFTGKKFAVISNQRIDTGAGVLKNAVMPLPTILLGLFGTSATFYLNGTSSYNPVTGAVVATAPEPVSTKIYLEGYSLKEIGEAPELQSGDIKAYVPGQAFGYEETALLILQIRESGGTNGRIR